MIVAASCTPESRVQIEIFLFIGVDRSLLEADSPHKCKYLSDLMKAIAWVHR